MTHRRAPLASNATAEINWAIAAVGGMTLLIISMIAVAAFNRLLKYSEVR